MTLRAPFPWFGGKSRVAPLVWERFGDVRNYVEPFAGSLAVLLGRPTVAKVETVNDRDAYLCNFWRALQQDPELVAHFADYPVNETDLHARHLWLVTTARERVQQLVTDPESYDAKIAGWWVWGLCAWIGGGWCRDITAGTTDGSQRPHLSSDQGVLRTEHRPPVLGTAGRGLEGFSTPHKKLPSVGHGERRVHRASLHVQARMPSPSSRGPHVKRPMLTSKGGGVGGHRPRLHGQLPDLGGDSGATGRGMNASAWPATKGDLYEYMELLSLRLRRVRITCGDWSRILGPAVTTCIGVTGVFLDPPYSHAERDKTIYAEDHDVGAAVREWAIANGENRELRIALCGYQGEHTMPETWTCVPWKAAGGYGRSERGKENAGRERIWFSPNCLPVNAVQHSLLLDDERLA